jgi:hypothetical protein
MTVLVMTAAPVPPVVVTASPMHVTVAVATPMLDLDDGAVICGHRGHAQPGGRGYGHGQRSNQGGSNQGDSSHQISSRSRDCDVMHKRAGERLFRSAGRNNGRGHAGRLQFAPHHAGPKFHSAVFGKNRQCALSLADDGEEQMADRDIVEIACARAWGAYCLINRAVDENDARREQLHRFIGERWEAGARETEQLAVEGLKYLKTLDGSLAG